MNKDRRDYIYNPKEWRRNAPARPPAGASKSDGKNLFWRGVIVGIIIGYYTARHFA